MTKSPENPNGKKGIIGKIRHLPEKFHSHAREESRGRPTLEEQLREKGLPSTKPRPTLKEQLDAADSQKIRESIEDLGKVIDEMNRGNAEFDEAVIRAPRDAGEPEKAENYKKTIQKLDTPTISNKIMNNSFIRKVMRKLRKLP